jgi:predicted transcriptional regulator
MNPGTSVLIFTIDRNTILPKPYYARSVMKTIAIKLPDDLLAAIQFAAKKRGETRSAVMREALQEFLSKNQNTGSCLDLARDLAGRVQGPSDLSTNPAHMDHYGK